MGYVRIVERLVWFHIPTYLHWFSPVKNWLDIWGKIHLQLCAHVIVLELNHDKKILSMGGLLKSDLTGHGHFSQIERKGLNVCALLGQPSKVGVLLSYRQFDTVLSENKFLIGVHYTVIKPIRYNTIESNYGYLSVFQTITPAYHVQTWNQQTVEMWQMWFLPCHQERSWSTWAILPSDWKWVKSVWYLWLQHSPTLKFERSHGFSSCQKEEFHLQCLWKTVLCQTKNGKAYQE